MIIAKQEWAQNNKIPCVIGAIDCTHIRIYKPKEFGDEYINRKGFPSFNVQATCNSKEYFTSVSAEWPGSVHDSRIFKNSDIGIFLKQRTENVVLIGDSGYAITPWLITPYCDPVNNIQKNFNKIYARERVVIERCFGQVKRRFPILQYKVRVTLKNVPKIIICCFIFHNVAKYLNDPDDFLNHNEDEDEESNVNENSNYNDIRIRAMGQEQRDRFAEMLANL